MCTVPEHDASGLARRYPGILALQVTRKTGLHTDGAEPDEPGHRIALQNRVIPRLRLSIAAVATFALAVQPAFAGPDRGGRGRKVDSALTESVASGAQTQRVIITVEPGFRDGVRDALKKHGDVIKSEHPSIESIAAVVHSADVSELANHPGVRYVSSDATVFAGAARVRPTRWANRTVVTTSNALKSSGSEAQSTLRQTLGLPSKPSSATGAGITVAVIDSGIDPRGFGRRITAFYDFTRGGIPVQPFDDFGHGTHIAGLIGESATPFMGVAPDVNLVGLKVLDKDGQGSTSDVIKALEYVTVNRNRLGVQVVNLSLGHPIFAPANEDPLVAAVERASRAGLIVVASAGNFGINQGSGLPGYTGITSPGNAPSALTVGATDTKNSVTRDDDVVAPYSSRGPTWFDGYAKPDVVAPGTKMTSDGHGDQTLFEMLPLNVVLGANRRDYLQLSGTSMAAGVVSGVVALVLEAHNGAGYRGATPLTANAVKAMLEFSAIPVKGFDTLTQGAGQVNANGAIALASAIDTSAADNTWWLRAGVPTLTAIGGQTYSWSKTVVWGAKLLTGDLIFYDLKAWSQAADWGDNIVWGTRANVHSLNDNVVWGTAARGDNIVWGTNIVWTDRLIGLRDGDNIVWGTCTDGDNIVWGTMQGDNIVWGTMDRDNIVWGTFEGLDNIVWGTDADDNIVWGTSASNRQGGIF